MKILALVSSLFALACLAPIGCSSGSSSGFYTDPDAGEAGTPKGDGGPAPVHDAEVYRPDARPGCLAPHAWLDDGRSLYDLFGQGFALVAAAEADADEIRRAVEDARALTVPLTVVCPHEVPIAELYGAKMTLVRPDQHVAWRGDKWSDVLARATGRAA